MVNTDIETGLIGWLADEFPSPTRVVAETPANLGTVPCIQATRVAGGGEFFSTFDNPIFSIHCFGKTRALAADLAESVRVAMRDDLEGQSLGTAFVLSVSTQQAPAWTPYDNTNLRRFTATYALRVHHH